MKKRNDKREKHGENSHGDIIWRNGVMAAVAAARIGNIWRISGLQRRK